MSTPVGPKMAAVFLIDCSPSMGEPAELVFPSTGAGAVKAERRLVQPLETMKEFTKAKIGQRIIRDLKTTPVCVLTFGTTKTKNLPSATLKHQLEHAYVKEDDPYRNIYEHIPLEYALSARTAGAVDAIVANHKQAHGSLNSALRVGLDRISAEVKVTNYAAKELYLLTDGESETDWEDVNDTIGDLRREGISLTVVGFNFDENDGEVKKEGGEEKTKIKRENERQLREIVDGVGNNSRFLSAGTALDSLSVPIVKEVNSTAVRMELTLGERPELSDPDREEKLARSIAIQVEVKKATMAANIKSMSKMSLSGFERIAAREAHLSSQSQRSNGKGKGEERSADAIRLKEATDADLLDKRQLYKLINEPISNEEFVRSAQDIFEDRRAKLDVKGFDTDVLLGHFIQSSLLQRETRQDLAHLGKSLRALLDEAGLSEAQGEDDDPHSVVREPRFYYKPKPAEEGQEEEDEGLEPVDGERLTSAYHYGGDIIPLEDMEQGTGELQGLQMGIQVNGFMKMKDFRFDYRLKDVSYVYAQQQFPGSCDLFSALINAMHERGSLAIVRYVAKGSNRDGVFKLPDPRMCALWPVIDEQGLEYAYMCQLPFAEDIRAFQFPSLTRLINRRGELVTNHKTLPTPAQTLAMDSFVDAMDLVDPDSTEDDPRSFFDVRDSFSPAIHNINNTLLHRLANPEGELPPVHESLKRYMDPPPEVVERAKKARERIVKEFEVKYVPPKSTTIRKATTNFGGEHDPDEHLRTDRLFGTNPDGSPAVQIPAQPTPAEKKAVPMEVDEDEPATDDELPASIKVKQETMVLDEDEEDEDEPKELSLTNPLPDFEAQLQAHGAGAAIKLAFSCAQKLVEMSFSSTKYPLALKVLLAARKAAEQKKAPKFFNTPVQKLVRELRGDPRKSDFVRRMREAGVGWVGEGGEALWEE